MAIKSKSIPVTLIIPAAGFGKRVGSPPAKELLPDLNTGKPLIQWSLELAKKRGWPVIVITRKDKTSLIHYLKNVRSHQPIKIHTINTSREWPDTLLKSQRYWGPRNLVLLPDTRFSPVDALDRIAKKLNQGSPTAFALFKLTTKHGPYQSWGIINTQQKLHCEKPNTIPFSSQRNCYGWGVFGFRQPFGVKLLKHLSLSTQTNAWKKLPASSAWIYLKTFEDLTR